MNALCGLFLRLLRLLSFPPPRKEAHAHVKMQDGLRCTRHRSVWPLCAPRSKCRMFSAARWRVPLVRQVSAVPAAAAPRLAAPPPRIPAANNLTAASLSTSSPAHASAKAKHAERRDKVQRRQTAREKRREKEERRDEALQQHNELQQAETRSKRTTGYVSAALRIASAVSLPVH